MLFLPKTLFLLLTIVFLLPFSVSPVLAQTKSGINIGDHFNEFDQAAKSMGDGGWVYVMACPGDAKKILGLAKQFPNVNLMIRGHYPGQNLSSNVAKAWIASLGDIPDSDFPNKVTFMPVNEPNNPQDAMPAPAVISYVRELIREAEESGVGAQRLKIISPMLDVYQLADTNGAYARELLSLDSNFFNQFDGLALNLYGEYLGGIPNQSAPPIKRGRGYNEFVGSLYGAQKPIYAPEAGVKKVGEPVRYKENIAPMRHFFGEYAGPIWANDANFVMFSVFSYDPHGDKTPWIYNSDVLSTMKDVGNGRMPEKATPLDEQKYRNWRKSVVLDPASFTTCGGEGLTQAVYADYYDTRYEGQIYKIRVNNVPIWQRELTITLKVSEDTLRHPDREWEVINVVFTKAREILKPLEFKNAVSKLPSPLLTDYIFAPVCRVESLAKGRIEPTVPPGPICQAAGMPCQEDYAEPCTTASGEGGRRICHKRGTCDAAGDGTHCSWGPGSYCEDECVADREVTVPEDITNEMKVNIRVEDKFQKNPGMAFPDAYSPGRFMQAALVPDQPMENKPIQIVAPDAPDEKEAVKPPADCHPGVFAYLDKAVSVTSSGQITFGGDLFGGVIEKIKELIGRIFPNIFQDVVIYFQWRSFKPLALDNKMVYADERTGLSSAFLPQEYRFTRHGETEAPVTVVGADGLEPASLGGVLGSNEASCPPGKVCQPDPLQNVSTKMPLAMLCAFLPKGIAQWDALGCKDIRPGRADTRQCMTESSTFRRLQAIVESCNANVTFVWEEMPGATRYKVDFQPLEKNNNDADWEPKPWDNGPNVWTSQTSMVKSMEYEGDAFNRDFWWRVLAMDECNLQKRAIGSATSPQAPGEHGYDGVEDDRAKIRIPCP